MEKIQPKDLEIIDHNPDRGQRQKRQGLNSKGQVGRPDQTETVSPRVARRESLLEIELL